MTYLSRRRFLSATGAAAAAPLVAPLLGAAPAYAQSGKVLTIVNPDPDTPLTPAEYPPGKLIKLSDPSRSPAN